MLHLLEAAGEVACPSAEPNRKAFVGSVAIRRDGKMVVSRNGITHKPDGKNPSVHSEARVLRKAGYGSIVYVARVLKDGSYAMSKPCGYCMAALRGRGVKMVYYTISPTKWEACVP